MEGLMQCGANYVPLTPVSFLERAAQLYPDQTSVIHGDVTYTWKLTHQRCIKLASALSSLGICYGDFVVALIPNTPEMYELHFGVAFAGGVLSTMNPSLEASNLFPIFEELEPKFVFVDHNYVEVFLPIINLHNNKKNKATQLVLTSSMSSSSKKISSHLYYNELLDLGKLDTFQPIMPKCERHPILVSYTSGSTSDHKNVVYSHRATYLNTIGEILRSDFRDQSKVVFLWTADMFLANGWGFIWAIAALGGINVFPSSLNLFDSIYTYKVTHLSGHPSIFSKIIEEHKKSSSTALPHKVYAHIASEFPSSDVLNRVREFGFEVVHRNGTIDTQGAPFIENLQSCSREKILNNKPNLIDHLIEESNDNMYLTRTIKSMPGEGTFIEDVMCKENVLVME